MSDDERKAEVFARFLLQRGSLTGAQAAEAFRQFRQQGGGQPFGAILVQRGMMTPLDVREAITELRQADLRSLPPLPESAPPPLARAVPVATGGPAIQPPRLRPPPPPPPSVAAVARAAAEAQAQPQVPPPVRAPVTARPAGALGSLPSLLEAAERRGASDVHLHPGVPVALRVEGRLGVVGQQFDKQEQERMLLDILTDEQRTTLLETGDLDFAYVTPGGLRTRANFYRASNGIDATFRLLSRVPRSLEELNLPQAIAKLVDWHQGLVLVTGPAGSGKSTTLAALVDILNSRSPDHILSLEDPIEILHPAKRALVNQRQISRDTESFARALRGALREDPDVIVIGELRDMETISLAITAAETGHLVIGSMQTNNATRTIARLVDVFPPGQQGQVRTMLSESLRGVVSQRLVLGLDGKRLPATEILFVNQAIGNIIRENKLFQIKSLITTGRSLGMCSLDDSLADLVRAGKVAPEVAKRLAETPSVIPDGAKPLAPPTPAVASPATKTAAPSGRPSFFSRSGKN